MGNLLVYNDSFNWEDSNLNRGVAIHNLNEAINTAKGYKDNFFKTPDLASIILSWGNFMEFMFSYGYEEEIRKQTFPWMTQIHHTTLVHILSSLKNTKVLDSQSLDEMRIKFPNINCGYLGFEMLKLISDYVFNNESLDSFHKRYVTTFNYQRRKTEYKYFSKFYKPELNTDPNQINQAINNKRVAPIFQAIHQPKVKGEQIHMHFNASSNCALNLDGSWKHNVQGFIITTQACVELSLWGFLLPVEYYK